MATTNEFLIIEGENLANTNQSGLEFFNLTKNEITQPYQVPGQTPTQQQNSSLISPDGSTFWSVGTSSLGNITLIPFYFNTLQAGETIETSVSGEVLALYFDNAGKNIFLVTPEYIYVFNIASLGITNTIALPALPSYYQSFLSNGAILSAIQPNGEYIWLLYPNGSIQSFSLSNYSLSSVIDVILPYETVSNGTTYVYLPMLSSGNSFMEISPDSSTIWLATNFYYNEQGATMIGFNGTTTTTIYTTNNIFSINIPSGIINSTIDVNNNYEFDGIIINPSNSNIIISFVDISTSTYATGFLIINSIGTRTFTPSTILQPEGLEQNFLFNSDSSILYYIGNQYTCKLNPISLEITPLTTFVGSLIGIVNLDVNNQPQPPKIPFISFNYRFHFLNCNYLSDILSQEAGIDK